MTSVHEHYWTHDHPVAIPDVQGHAYEEHALVFEQLTNVEQLLVDRNATGQERMVNRCSSCGFGRRVHRRLVLEAGDGEGIRPKGPNWQRGEEL